MGPERHLGCFWRYGAILGSALRGQKVAISLVLDGFLRCHVFLMFFHRYLKATLFSLKTQNHILILLIMGGPNVDISLVLAMVLEIYVFRRCVFNDFLLRFRCKNHVHWWSPRLKNSGNPCAKLIILVFSICSIVKDLEKHEKFMKFSCFFKSLTIEKPKKHKLSISHKDFHCF